MKDGSPGSLIFVLHHLVFQLPCVAKFSVCRSSVRIVFFTFLRCSFIFCSLSFCSWKSLCTHAHTRITGIRPTLSLFLLLVPFTVFKIHLRNSCPINISLPSQCPSSIHHDMPRTPTNVQSTFELLATLALPTLLSLPKLLIPVCPSFR